MPSSIYKILLHQQQLWLAEQQRFWQRLADFPRAMDVARETRVGTTPHEVVFEERTLKLLRYRRETPARFEEPVLFCYALINRPYILDLQPEKSVVGQYLKRGFDVYMIDWGVPSEVDRTLRLEDYVCGALKRVVEFVLRQHQAERLHLLGYCMGGTMGALFTALHPQAIRTLTLLASPIEFSDRSSLASIWADAKYFDVDGFLAAHGNCPASFLQACFLFMRPVQNLLEKHIAFWEHIEDPRFVAGYFAMERWVNDNIPVAGETFRQFVKSCYQRNEIVQGTFRLGASPVNLGRIVCPLLLLTAKNDHLVVPASTEGIRPYVSSRDIRTMMIDAGHVGLVVSGKAQSRFWPEATAWLAERSTIHRDPLQSWVGEAMASDAQRQTGAQRQDFAGLLPEQGAKSEADHETEPVMKPIGDSSSREDSP